MTIGPRKGGGRGCAVIALATLAAIGARNPDAQGLEEAAGQPGVPEAVPALAGDEGELAGAMGRLLALSEAYPDLKASANMQQLTEELTSTENKVAFSRQAFNDSVTEYNTYKQSFPAVLFAGAFGHATDAALLEFDSEAIAQPPKVSF